VQSPYAETPLSEVRVPQTDHSEDIQSHADGRDEDWAASVLASIRGTVVMSPDKKSFFVLASDRQLLACSTSRQLVDVTPFGIRTINYFDNCRKIVTGGSDGMIRIWDTRSATQTSSWRASLEGVSTVVASKVESPDSSTASETSSEFVSGTLDGVVRLWTRHSTSEATQEFHNRESISMSDEIVREMAPISCVRLSDDGRLLAVASGDSSNLAAGRISIRRTSDWSETVSMNWSQSTAVVAFGRESDSLYSGDWQGRIARWNTSTGELMGFVEGYQLAVYASQISPETSQLANVNVPDLPISLLVGDASQDEKVKSVWDQITTKATQLTRPFRKHHNSPMP